MTSRPQLRRVTGAVATGLAVAAVAAPAAHARIALDPPGAPTRDAARPAPGYRSAVPPVRIIPAPTVVHADAGGFDVGSAGIGAAATALLVLLAAGGTVVVSRSRLHGAR
jgi:hypothetical protein